MSSLVDLILSFFAWEYVDMEDFAFWGYLYIKTRLHQSDCHTDLVVFGL
jgi:hypothetical protein